MHKHSPGYAETSTHGDRFKNRGRDSKGEGLAKYKHHACSIMAKSSHTHTQAEAVVAKITLTCPHFHLHSSMAKSMLFPKQKDCQRWGQGSKSPLTGSMDGPGRLMALSHHWAVFGFEQKHVIPRWKESPNQRTQRESGQVKKGI